MNGYYLCLGKPLFDFFGNSKCYKGVDRDKTFYYLGDSINSSNRLLSNTLINNETEAIEMFESIIRIDEFIDCEEIELIYVNKQKVNNKFLFLGWDISWDFESSVIAQLLDIPYWQTDDSSKDSFKKHRDKFYKKLNKYVLFNTDKEAKKLIMLIEESTLDRNECEWLGNELFPLAVYLVRSNLSKTT